MTTLEKFENIVEDTFYSHVSQCWLLVDDNSDLYEVADIDGNGRILKYAGLSDVMIGLLYDEWKNFQDTLLQQVFYSEFMRNLR